MSIFNLTQKQCFLRVEYFCFDAKYYGSHFGTAGFSIGQQLMIQKGLNRMSLTSQLSDVESK